MNKLTLVISGQIVREDSANLRNFWQGFLNIQGSISDIQELRIVAHSWNPEFDKLVSAVYRPDILASETQPSFAKEYLPLLNPIDKFERGLKRSQSIWKRVSYQAILGNAKSRSYAIALLKQINLREEDRVLAVRWDAGCTGSKDVHTIICDNGLNASYFYSSYYSEIDEGYGDMWFLTSYKIAASFENYANHVLDSLAGKNNFFTRFTEKGWFLAIAKSEKQSISQERKKAYLNRLNKIPLRLLERISPSFLRRIISDWRARIKSYVEAPIITGENSLPIDSVTNVKFPNYVALNNHAILKSFIHDNNLREKTRFLSIDDFARTSKGQMINPLSFCYLIYSHSSFSDCWELAINQAIQNLPANCSAIYLLSERSDETLLKFEQQSQKSRINLVTYDGTAEYTDRLIEVFSEISTKFSLCYFVHEDMPLYSEINYTYLNTLLHYMNHSQEYYIKLVDTTYVDEKQDHTSFPGLVKNTGGYSISVQPALMKLDFMIPFLSGFRQNIYGFEELCTRANLTFSAVAGTRKVGSYLLANTRFPHIATAISKGKWCTSEWGEELGYLAEKYQIDLSIRGEC